ncbi:MAG: DUF2147 domain-containing protein [Bacteroidetes bacterium]|nr:MAG: DUF2147 domain-containing protein [Bacteroidota bacterium]
MKNLFNVVMLFLFLPAMGQFEPGAGQGNNHADLITGNYELPNGLWVKIYRQGNTYNGKILSVDHYIEEETLDIKNPARHLRSRPLVGLEIISGLTYDPGSRQWIKGEMYAPEKGMTVNLRIENADANELVVVGSKLMFRKTLSWERLP